MSVRTTKVDKFREAFGQTLERQVPSPENAIRSHWQPKLSLMNTLRTPRWQLVDDPPGVGSVPTDGVCTAITLQRTTFPVDSLTAEQRNIFEQFLSERYGDY